MQLSEKLTKEIYKKYPKIYNEICNKYNKLQFISMSKESSIGISVLWTYLSSKECDSKYIELPFSMLYGLLIDFFDDNKIIIDIIYDSENNDFWYTVNRNQFNIFDSHHDIKEHYPRQEAQYQAILKACEIKENADAKQ